MMRGRGRGEQIFFGGEGGGRIFGCFECFGETNGYIGMFFFMNAVLFFLRPTCDIYVSKIY